MKNKISTVLIIAGLLGLIFSGVWFGHWWATRNSKPPVITAPETRDSTIKLREDTFSLRYRIVDSMNHVLERTRISDKENLKTLKDRNRKLESKVNMIISSARPDSSLSGDPYPPAYMEDYTILEQYRDNNRAKDSLNEKIMEEQQQQINNMEIQLTAKDSLYDALRIDLNNAHMDITKFTKTNLGLQAKINTTKAGKAIGWKILTGALAVLLIYQSVK